jgi:hypothetical protein
MVRARSRKRASPERRAQAARPRTANQLTFSQVDPRQYSSASKAGIAPRHGRDRPAGGEAVRVLQVGEEAPRALDRNQLAGVEGDERGVGHDIDGAGRLAPAVEVEAALLVPQLLVHRARDGRRLAAVAGRGAGLAERVADARHCVEPGVEEGLHLDRDVAVEREPAAIRLGGRERARSLVLVDRLQVLQHEEAGGQQLGRLRAVGLTVPLSSARGVRPVASRRWKAPSARGVASAPVSQTWWQTTSFSPRGSRRRSHQS